MLRHGQRCSASPRRCSRCRPRLRCRSLALIVYGAADAISVVIRQSLVQTRTPHDMLGRVMAVNSMFTGTSGTLGEFRAGALAASIGAVPSALIGGVGVVLIALAWYRLFPALRGIERLTGETGERVPEDAVTAE